MIRHAILITAYTDFFHLINLVKSFDGRFDVYIHIDKKAYINNDCSQVLSSCTNVKIVKKVYSVEWGGRNHVDAILWLCKQAVEHSKKDVSFFHLISGADLLVRSLDEFCNFFEFHQGENFLDYFRLPYIGWNQGGFNRLEFYHPLDRINIKTNWGNSVYNRYMNWQIRKGHVRPLPLFDLYGGSTWWSLTREAVVFICSHYNWNNWYDRLKDCFVPEEMYVQTLLLNSPYKSTIINNNLRYIVWEYKNGNIPAILDGADISPILQSHAIFARKVESKISRELIDFFKIHNSSR